MFLVPRFPVGRLSVKKKWRGSLYLSLVPQSKVLAYPYSLNEQYREPTPNM